MASNGSSSIGKGQLEQVHTRTYTTAIISVLFPKLISPLLSFDVRYASNNAEVLGISYKFLETEQMIFICIDTSRSLL